MLIKKQLIYHNVHVLEIQRSEMNTPAILVSDETSLELNALLVFSISEKMWINWRKARKKGLTGQINKTKNRSPIKG